MKYLLFVLLLVVHLSRGQSVDQVILPAEVSRIEKFLSSDDMKGRKVYSPEIEKAADFISAEFKTAGLLPFVDGTSYRQSFALLKTSLISANVSFDGLPIDSHDVLTVSSMPLLRCTQHSGYEKVFIRKGQNLQLRARGYLAQSHNTLVLIDTVLRSEAHILLSLRRSQFKSSRTVIFVFTQADPAAFDIQVRQHVEAAPLFNVVGVLPGKSRKNEYVIFSAHYDHLGTGKPTVGTDSIYNGANDDASGSTAVMMLAKYFGARHDNERTLLFATFTAEEIGEYGSLYFSRTLDPSSLKAMVNIEMIGTPSKWGFKSAFITGYEKTDMGAILNKNSQNSGFKFYPDPYISEDLFYRSDNASLAKLGVAAHTISTSKMDAEKYYHTQGDEMSTLDMNNMTDVIKAIATSATSLISGEDTPSRVNTTESL